MVLLGAREAAPQALHAERFPAGCELVFITQALAGATTIGWPGADGEIHTATWGQLNLIPNVEAALTELDPPPPVVVVVGGAQFAELRSAIERVLAGRPPAPVEARSLSFDEGGIDRRLGSPDRGAVVRLEVPLPPPDDWRRSTVEVMWELMPELLSAEQPGFRSRIDDDRAILEGPVDEELADLQLRQLRFAIARVGDSRVLDGDRVEAARARLEVRRKAQVGSHPEGAREVLARWLGGGMAGVREYLFGIEGVTEISVREAARTWLPQHPGTAVLILPPRVFNPRFAPGPEVLRLENDASAAILERAVTGLSVLSLRPIVLPDVDGELTATVLARVATALRAAEGAPGWVRVVGSPPILEMASSPDGLPEIVEVLQEALGEVAEDDRAVATEGGSARRRALQLMAGVLGLTAGGELSPAVVLRPSNLAIGVVGPDAETAAEALTKFRLGGADPATALIGESVQPVPRTREAAPGGDSALAVALDVGVATNALAREVAAEVLRQRLERLEIAETVEVLRPVVPGRNVLLPVLQVRGPLDALEGSLAKTWSRVRVDVGEDEADEASRAVASRVAADASGPLGQARRCAAVAAGTGPWRSSEDLERELLGVSAEELTAVIGLLPDWQELATTGAGALPVPGTPPR
jgi:hypothetical protein